MVALYLEMRILVECYCESKERKRQRSQYPSEANNLSGRSFLVGGQTSHQGADFRNGLRDARRIILGCGVSRLIQRLLVDVKKLLLDGTRKVIFYPCSVLSLAHRNYSLLRQR